MKYHDKEISQLWDIELLTAYKYCLYQEEQRDKARSHEKFKPKKVNGKIIKLEFPPANPAFLQLKQELFNEIQKRKLTL